VPSAYYFNLFFLAYAREVLFIVALPSAEKKGDDQIFFLPGTGEVLFAGALPSAYA